MRDFPFCVAASARTRTTPVLVVVEARRHEAHHMQHGEKAPHRIKPPSAEGTRVTHKGASLMCHHPPLQLFITHTRSLLSSRKATIAHPSTSPHPPSPARLFPTSPRRATKEGRLQGLQGLQKGTPIKEQPLQTTAAFFTIGTVLSFVIRQRRIESPERGRPRRHPSGADKQGTKAKRWTPLLNLKDLCAVGVIDHKGTRREGERGVITRHTT